MRFIPMESAPQNRTKLGERVVDVLQGLFGKYPGFRATHAKGILCSGSFTRHLLRHR